MAEISEHLEQARHNEECAKALDRTKYGDWAMTVVYYAALQYIDALLASKGCTPGGHDVRDAEMTKNVELLPIAKQYFSLKSRSRNARYYCYRFTAGDVAKAEAGELAAIKKQLLPMLGKA